MNRAVLQACVPCLAALAASCAALALIVRLSGARLRWKRLKELHSCQDGGVQSLAFVLTLPFFIVIAQFIVQISQLMIGVMTVNYAAYAAARSAAVWTTAAIGDLEENKLNAPITESQSVVLTSTSDLLRSHPKYQQIFKAATLACLPAAPSRNLGLSLENNNQRIAAALEGLYALLAPKSQQNSRTNPRLENKLAWSWQHTAVRVSFVDKDTRQGPTYNPRLPVLVTLPNGEQVWERDWDPHEVGWQDPITVQVTHEFALLPGPGRFLAKQLVRADGQPDRVADLIQQTQTNARERVYTVSIWASATATAEGFKSVVPYVQMP